VGGPASKLPLGSFAAPPPSISGRLIRLEIGRTWLRARGNYAAVGAGDRPLICRFSSFCVCSFVSFSSTVVCLHDGLSHRRHAWGGQSVGGVSLCGHGS
jgi:hypothetical protein